MCLPFWIRLTKTVRPSSSGSLAEVNPIRSAIAGSTKSSGIDQGFQNQRCIRVLAPIVSELSSRARQNRRGESFNLNGRKNEETPIIDDVLRDCVRVVADSSQSTGRALRSSTQDWSTTGRPGFGLCRIGRSTVTEHRLAPLHNAHSLEIVTVYYRWHPFFGLSLPVWRRSKHRDDERIYCKAPDGRICVLPEWMLRAECAHLCATFNGGDSPEGWPWRVANPASSWLLLLVTGRENRKGCR